MDPRHCTTPVTSRDTGIKAHQVRVEATPSCCPDSNELSVVYQETEAQFRGIWELEGCEPSIPKFYPVSAVLVSVSTHT